MSHRFVLSAALLAFSPVLLAATAPNVQSSEARGSDRAQINRLLADWETSWNTHDMHRLAALFWEDGVWVLWNGEVWTGRAPFEAGMTKVHKTFYRNSIQREQLEELTFAGQDVAVLRFYSTLTGDMRNPDRTIRSRKILVLTRREGQWRVGWGQNTRFFADLQPPAAPRR